MDNQDYRNAQNKYKAFIKNKVQRQVQIVKPDATQGQHTCVCVCVFLL